MRGNDEEGDTMFDVHCEGHGGPTLVSARGIVGLDQRDGQITLHLRCWCGHVIAHRTGRAARHGDTAEPAQPIPTASAVAAVPPARSSRAASHFAARLGYETDPADVWTDLRSGAGSFVLVDARSREAYEEAHLPGAVSMPHAELEAAWARTLLVERGADLVVTYCWRASCNAATKAAAKLAAWGVPVKEMLGGIEGWVAEGLPVVSGHPDGEVPREATLASCQAAG